MNDTTLALNDHGTPVSVHICSACGTTFTLCPADLDGTFGDDCTGVGCPSYDPARDIDALWDQMEQRGHIIREESR